MNKYLALLLLAVISTASLAEEIPNVSPFYASLLTQVHLNEPDYWPTYRQQKEVRAVVEGIGWGAFRLDATTNELLAVFGTPDQKNPPGTLRWSKYRIECHIDDEGLVNGLTFLPGFKYALTTGLGIGSPRIKSLSYYGVPQRNVRSNEIEILYYPHRQLTITCSNSYITQIDFSRPNHPPKQPNMPIIPLKGWGAFRLGANHAELTDTFGPADIGSTSTFLRWKRYNMYCLVNPYYGAYVLCFEPGFANPLTSGIALGSPAETVIAQHGQPDAITQVGKVKRYIYSKQRVVFSIDAGLVSRILLLPEQALSPMLLLPSEGSGWGAFRVGATREDILNVLGQPDCDPQDKHLKWDNLSLSCVFDNQGVVKEVRFGKNFHFPFNNGIAIGAHLNDINRVYGRPSEYNHEKTLFSYPQKGVMFHFQNNKVDEIIITRKPINHPNKPKADHH